MVLALLRSIATISACRDRDRLPRALFRAAEALLGGAADIGIYARETQGETVLRLFAGPTMHSAVSLWPEIIDDLRSDGKVLSRCIEGRYCGALALYTSETASDQMILAFAVNEADVADQVETIASLAQIHDNQIKLLDYSELDTLTRLLNRKPGSASSTSITSSGSMIPSGIFSATEVLLRIGELLRKTFRGGDRLFRLGGEEFVVILNAGNETLAAISFNRFRKVVENHEFPRVGRVTCSIGITTVAASDVPTDVVGRADEALYHAKEHGRNQVCCYERLLLEGAIAKPTVAGAPVEEDFDIDALFE
jgi:hypothetical protein